MSNSSKRRDFIRSAVKAGGMAGMAAMALSVPARAQGGKVDRTPAGARVGNLIFTSGLTGVIKDAPNNSGGTIEEQTRSILEKHKANLAAAGTSLDNVLKVTVFMSDIRNDKPGMNKVYAEYFTKERPSRSAVGVDFPDDQTRIEIEMIAWVP